MKNFLCYSAIFLLGVTFGRFVALVDEIPDVEKPIATDVSTAPIAMKSIELQQLLVTTAPADPFQFVLKDPKGVIIEEWIYDRRR